MVGNLLIPLWGLKTPMSVVRFRLLAPLLIKKENMSRKDRAPFDHPTDKTRKSARRMMKSTKNTIVADVTRLN